MTIAELLVQTTATLRAECGVFTVNDYREKTARVYPLQACIADARAIVAAIYGEPCADFKSPVYHETGTDKFCVPYTRRLQDCLPGDSCDRCQWPLGQHGAKP